LEDGRIEMLGRVFSPVNAIGYCGHGSAGATSGPISDTLVDSLAASFSSFMTAQQYENNQK
jgi:hypothetical protein